MEDWLIGVYDGDLVTVSKGELPGLVFRNNRMYETLIYNADFNRANLRPYFFILTPVADAHFLDGDERIIEECGLPAIAYKYSGIAPIPAQGHAEAGCFVIDKEKVPADIGSAGVCVLALKTKGFWVRTGTFFMFSASEKKVEFKPCIKDKKCLVGKGVLLGLSRYSRRIGTMGKKEAAREMMCRASRSEAVFHNKGANPLHRGNFFIVYRHVLSDLRADMPAAIYKVAAIGGAFEKMFNVLGFCVKENYEKFGCIPTKSWEHNVQLDGMLVDFGRFFEKRTAKSQKFLTKVVGNLRSVLFFSALISFGGKNALSAMAEGKKETQRFVNDNKDGIYGHYLRFFERFDEGVGGQTKDFVSLKGEDNVSGFFKYRQAKVWEVWEWGIWKLIGWRAARPSS